MPNVNAPRGFKPRKDAIGSAWASTINSYPIPSGYGTTLFTGDVAKLLTTGYVAKAAAAEQMRGVFAGFRWTDLSGLTRSSPYWPAGTVTMGGRDAVAYLHDDPNTIFEAQFTNSATVPGNNVQGKTFASYDAGGTPSNGLGGQGIDLTTQNTTAQQWRCIGFATRPDNDITAANSYGWFMPSLHDLRVNTGV